MSGIDLYFSDHDITAGEMTDLENGTPVAGIVGQRIRYWAEAAIVYAKLGRDTTLCKRDSGNARRTLVTALSYNGTRVAAVKRLS